MNTKSKISAIALLAAPLVIVALIYLTLKEILGDKKTEKQQEAASMKTETEFKRKEAKTPAFRPLSAKSAVKSKPYSVPVPTSILPETVPSALKTFELMIPRAMVPPVSTTPVVKPLTPVIPPTKTTATIPSMNRRFITREHLAVIFKNGACLLDRKTAVAALQSLGFGKTAAYAALSPDGRFSTWLLCAPDGIMTWTN
jgi:hypothetical protein